ncbi:energy-coupling factor ABC transporter ATP-binding protein [Bacillus carboniphilus]|uniref:Energy-coupling factor ABC transporter ATP-binding protein n=2 Tax=Bacillus carboniphilus TaxID=86663 RepID=A0ABY9JY79_9BACI|nr:energy-coupling factor ABC transporter ATP-binding protein [Bacillus carboniphilus]WLR44351.1 energy-coupling factor ABC transporter ATP-binding protein [Bacillus carboniphilus]
MNKVCFSYHNQEKYVLSNISLSVQKGEWIAIVGHNGSGKSTLARLMNGLLTTDQGTIKICGKTMTEDQIWDVRKHVGLVFQNPDNQFVGTTVQDDIAFGLENRGFDRETMVNRIGWAVNQVKLSDYLNQDPHQLSGGQKQRLAIAGIIALKPDLIIFDEATSMLDPSSRGDVMTTVQNLKNQGLASVISITHDLEEASMADRIIVLNQGEIIMEGSPQYVFQHNDMLKDVGLDIPYSLKISNLLKRNGVDIKDVHLTTDGLVEELWTLKSQT